MTATEQSSELEASPPADELAERLAAEIAKNEKLAESRLELARWFLDNGKREIARRRLQEIVGRFSESRACAAARELLNGL